MLGVSEPPHIPDRPGATPQRSALLLLWPCSARGVEIALRAGKPSLQLTKRKEMGCKENKGEEVGPIWLQIFDVFTAEQQDPDPNQFGKW